MINYSKNLKYMSKMKNTSMLSITNKNFLEELYEKFLNNPKDLDIEWQKFFSDFTDEKMQVEKLNQGASWKRIEEKDILAEESLSPPKVDAAASVSRKEVLMLQLQNMLDAYRMRGHLLADIDPLNLQKNTLPNDVFLMPSDFGILESDYQTKIDASKILPGYGEISVLDFIGLIGKIYSSKVGIECSHILNDQEQKWLYNKIENEIIHVDLDASEKKQLLETLIHAQTFEEFLHIKFPGAKRFSVEGGESSISATEFAVEQAAKMGVKRVVLGMAHRGRLNTLARIMEKPYVAMLYEFQGGASFPLEMGLMGDVIYHESYSVDKVTKSGHNIHLSMLPNPSHLETVNPVVAGKLRAEQDLIADTERNQVMGILIHGDASFAGQGIVTESLVQSELEGYTSGGIIHIIVNNQVGFTVDAWKARKSRYPSEGAKITNIPIFHVNGDEPEMVVKYVKLAVEYRNKFKKDVVIDITCYRLYGHNEGDEPNFTQPIMYKNIANHIPASQKYAEKLLSQNILTKDEIDNIKINFRAFLDDELIKSASYKPEANWLKDKWEGFKPANECHEQEITGVPLNILKKIGEKLSVVPNDTKINPKIARQLDLRMKTIESGANIDWATAELLAYGSLLIEGHPVRLSGQDAGRGTFSHRHSVLIDQENESQFIPLNNLAVGQANYEVTDSNLSEYAALGFEYGYSLTHPNALVLWEAQYGDFANGAQIVIDQYIASGETKFLRMSGLVMLLPHGMEGQASEHSSARLERYLQLCADDNMQVINATTPANIFHALRRQIHRNFRKPLIVMSPKSMLRNKMAVSNLNEMQDNTCFKKVIGEHQKFEKVRKVILCSGKVYYDLIAKREKDNIQNVAIIRIEQLYPFPADEIIDQLKQYSDFEIIWCQEEHKNAGGYHFILPRMIEISQKMKSTNAVINYAGRKEAAATAVGYKKLHEKELEEMLTEAFK